jgi:hypothetical protein
LWRCDILWYSPEQSDQEEKKGFKKMKKGYARWSRAEAYREERNEKLFVISKSLCQAGCFVRVILVPEPVLERRQGVASLRSQVADFLEIGID